VLASTLSDALQRLTASYDQRFEATFSIPSDYAGTPKLQEFSKDITANLIGGVGYFYGTSLVDKGFAYEWDQEDDAPGAADDEDDEYSARGGGAKLTEPRALLTATPSRSFFPRGFYWWG
jgi:mannosyl-oligosaccharide glucosidase